VISLYYYLRIIRAMFIEAPGSDSVDRFRTDGYNRLSLIVCVVGMITVGFVSGVYSYIAVVGF
jgi:NADH-quinone oxidoreductase subunit N